MFQTDKNIKTDGIEEAFVLFWIPLIFLLYQESELVSGCLGPVMSFP